MRNSHRSPATIALACMVLIWAASSANAAIPADSHAMPSLITFIPVPTATPTRTPTPVNFGNFVWDDRDGDGRQDAGEPGLAGIKVQLWNGAKNQLVALTTTNANGNYSLQSPGPGQYRIRVLLAQANDEFSPKDATTDTTDSDINPVGPDAGFTDIYTIAANVISITSIDAGIIVFRPPTATRTPTPINVGNRVWNDTNANGIQDAGEFGLNGIKVQLWNSTKSLMIDSTTTNANGNYSLVAPLPGSYRVRVLLPSGASFAPKDTIADTADSDINPAGADAGFTDIYTFASNVISITSIDAGMISVPATPTLTNTPPPSPTITPTAPSTPTATLPGSLVPRGYIPIARR